MQVTLPDRQERLERQYRLGKLQRPTNVVPLRAEATALEAWPVPVESITPGDVPLEPEEDLEPRYPTMAEIIRAVSVYYGVSVHEIKSERRMRAVVHARQVAYYLGRELTLLSFPAMGNAINRDHTSCIHGCYKIRDLRQSDPLLDQDIKAITSLIKGRAHV